MMTRLAMGLPTLSVTSYVFRPLSVMGAGGRGGVSGMGGGGFIVHHPPTNKKKLVRRVDGALQ